MAKEKHISIPLSNIAEDLELHIFPEGKSKVFKIEEAEAIEFGEFPYQILESQSYEYAFNKKGYRLSCDNKSIVKQSHREKFSGKINPSFYVGTLKLNITHKEKELKKKHTFLEVKATKFNSDNIDKSYRENYRYMLEDITEKCTELLLQVNSPIQQHFETDFNKKSESLYQQFSFVNSIIGSIEFEEAIQKIISSPKTDWADNEELADIRSVKKFTRTTIKQLVSRGNRISLPNSHPLFDKPLKNLPSHIINNRKVEIIDNAENRFIKHALQTYLHFSEKCLNKFKNETRAHKEAKYLTTKLELHLNNSFFKQVSRPTSLNFNSPVLQRKSGYREILKSWLKFDLAAKLTWTGGEDVYNAGKRDISKLYEYWLFFMLYDLFKSKFPIENIEHDGNPYHSLIRKTDKSLNFIIKSGTHTAFSGISEFENRKLNVRFSYNQTFKGDTKLSEKIEGSYTKNMYPDYTLSFWPADTTDEEAEEKELIVHIHFDAKYKVNYSGAIDDTRETEEESERKGDYKNVDLFKMHAYKDAIRRTGGAYILYPGNSKGDMKRGFHEIIPGLGAFALRPSLNNNGIAELSDFIDKIISHLLNRTSQRENIASKTYDIIKGGKPKPLNEPLPEYIHGKKLIPDDTYVLVGYCKSEEHLKWIEDKSLYNFRMYSNRGALKLNKETLNAKYLLLHMKGDTFSSRLYTIKKTEFRVTNKATLNRLNYPGPKQNSYLVIGIEKCIDKEFTNISWNFKKLKNYKSGRASAIPFTANLTDFIQQKIVD
ncbi:DUF2357 domain-containing protein [Oceanihabitans sp. 2_MG-2023]|uniref:DUF2357 domain-containing protein n=1 Tax=Oceanihabitans sp. 2_MG-2023 TaxID=3062661 RepID=UPI0026E22B12|nr:DUF2357 domain-containing protein [Oceanihabitans sp. 2_MG-2023]MDO6596402.1 DUF2357 domain-containing protein [Oceanihabitans sp. 2_MG-2023]